MTTINRLSFHRDSSSVHNILKLLTLLVFFLFFFLSFLRTHVDNYDFWWHLATGKYIVETGGLPAEDPFSFTTPTTPSARIPIILKGYWLAQVIFYKAYALWDLKAIVVIRSVVMLLFLIFVFLTVKRQASSFFLPLFFVTLLFMIVAPYCADRPQLFTFLVFSIVYYLLEDYRIAQSKKIFFIPVLMLILSNMHPGYIICLMLISLYLFASLIRHFFIKDCKKNFQWLLGVWMLSILLSAANPTGLGELKEIFLFSRTDYTREIVEFMPTFSLFAKGLTPINYPYITFLFCSFVSVFLLRRIDLTHLLLLAVFSLMSVLAVRYVLFYMCISAPILAKAVLVISEKEPFAKRIAIFNDAKPVLYLAACLVGVLLFLSSLTSLGSREIKMTFLSDVPKNAADFLKGLSVQGNMLNDYGFGGYLIWRLYPEKKVFIDGRTLSADTYNEYKIAILARRTQFQSWEDVIKKHRVSYVVVPPLTYHGQILPLVEQLYDSNDWALIYQDDLSLIFLHNESKNAPLINQYAIDKREVLHAIVTHAVAKSATDQTNPYYLMSAGKAFLKLGRRDEAEKVFLMALERAPQNAEAARWIRQLSDGR